jgi:hypothetical protein
VQELPLEDVGREEHVLPFEEVEEVFVGHVGLAVQLLLFACV